MAHRDNRERANAGPRGHSPQATRQAGQRGPIGINNRHETPLDRCFTAGVLVEVADAAAPPGLVRWEDRDHL
eukprot:5193944-Alexandrium_andersonii.AAC.1